MWSVVAMFFIAGVIAVFVACGDVVQNLRSAGAVAPPDYRACASNVLTVDVYRGTSHLGAYVVYLPGGELTQGPFRSTTGSMML